jgi:hypothetical protein
MRGFLSKLPPGVKPRAGNGELLLLKSATGVSQVVRLHCALDPYALVMMPTGDLKFIERTKTKPATDPFVAASPAEMEESLKAAGLSKFKVEKGPFYYYVYDCSDGFFMHARSILETMLPGVVENLKSWGLKVKRPDVPMVVVIMPNRAAFDAYSPMPEDAAAYYNLMTNRVVMYEDQELWEAAPEYAAKKAGYTIAHESVHQLLANIGIQSRLSNWSPWICEGLAEYYCPLKVNSSLIRKANSELPTRTMKWTKAGMINDLRMHSLLKMNASGSLLEKLIEAEDIDADGYALAWGLVHYLANKKPEAFCAYMSDVSKYNPLDTATAPAARKADPLFVKHFGSDFESRLRRIYDRARTVQEIAAELRRLREDMDEQRSRFEEVWARTAGLIESRFDQRVRQVFHDVEGRQSADARVGLAIDRGRRCWPGRGRHYVFAGAKDCGP